MSKKISNDEVKKFIEVISESGCKLLSEYTGIFDKLDIKCHCGNEFQTPFKTFRDGGKRSCNECTGVVKYDIFKVKEFIESNSNCILLSNTYKNNTTKLSILCACGDEFSTTFNSFKQDNKRQCDKCGYGEAGLKRRKTNEKFHEEISSLLGNEFELVGEYTGAFNTVEIKHKTCNHTFTRIAKNLFRNKSKITCPDCDITKYSTVKKIINESGCELLTPEEKYKSETTKLKIKCRCGDTFIQSFVTFKRGEHHGCPKCYHIFNSCKQRMKTHKVLEYINSVGCEWLSGEYINLKSKLEISCKVCNSPFTTCMDKFIYEDKHKCNDCAKLKSKGEDTIEEILNKYKIIHKFDIHLNGLKGIKNGRMRLDFVIYNHSNNKVIGSIEYDGAQHFKLGGDKKYYNDKQIFDDRVENDKTKNQYCIQNNINLLRIPYWEKENIEYIIVNFLVYLNLIKIQNVDEFILQNYLVNHSDWVHEKYLEQADL